MLAPEVVRRADGAELRGARRIAEETAGNAARFAATALVNGRVGAVVAPRGRLALDITTSGDRVTAIEVIETRPSSASFA